MVSGSTSELCRQVQNNTLLGNTEYAPTCNMSNCMNKIIAHRHHISFNVARKVPVVLYFCCFLFLILYQVLFFHKLTKYDFKKKKREREKKIMTTALEYEKKR